MQYHPKLKKAMAQIKDILIENDIAGVVILHTPGFSEFLNHLTPSYSCVKYSGGDVMQIRAKKEDFNGDAEKRNQVLCDTSNMFYNLSTIATETAYNLSGVSEKLDAILKAEHYGDGYSSHTDQNN